MKFEDQKAFGKQYWTLLFDSIQMLDNGNYVSEDIANSFYRSSIISCILSLECAANICLDSLSLKKKFYNEIEKLGTIAKFDFFAFTKCGQNIDYSLNQYQKAIEIIKVRNDYVHPKVINGTFSNEYEGEFGIYSCLNISKDIVKWGLEDAQKVLNANIEFLNYIFMDLCKLDARKLTTILTCSEENLCKKNISTFIELSEKYYKLLNKYISVNINYIDIRMVY